MKKKTTQKVFATISSEFIVNPHVLYAYGRMSKPHKYKTNTTSVRDKHRPDVNLRKF